MDAIKAGDPQAATQAMRQHFENSLKATSGEAIP
jgi:DNA-binding FadR family transcriptional regulator